MSHDRTAVSVSLQSPASEQYRFLAAISTSDVSRRGFAKAAEMARAREVAAHPDLAELDAQADIFYEIPGGAA